MSGDEPPAVVERRPVVVTALPLPVGARARLAELLGDVRVVDLRDAIGDADLVVTPPCSPQAIARLAHAFPSARLVVAELADREHGVELPGPVRRLRDAGADAYLTADSLAELAELLLGRRPPPVRTVTDAETPPALGTRTVSREIIAELDRALAERVRRARR